jgi:hypothetical protein
MARKDVTCWRCGARWSAEARPRATLTAVPEDAPAHVADASQPSIGAAVVDARAAIQARLEADRWIDEGGSLGREAPRRSPTVAGRR